mmetsp:Transcript_17814/g.45589  ORF Transcript_17814/g.45589 Transcript_17814/m.45589 type:complete len:219 (-) Transcript_17814:1389-2045(-)
MRRLSWRCVPTTCSPPSATTSARSSASTASNSASTASSAVRATASAEPETTGELLAARASSMSSPAGSNPSTARQAASAVAARTSAPALGSAGSSTSSLSSSVPTADASCLRSQTRASAPALPPSKMSVPRPAMFVERVTAPRLPACAITKPSRLALSARALRTSCAMPSASSATERSSESAMLAVPTSTGLPCTCIRFTSSMKALRLPSLFTKMTSA